MRKQLPPCPACGKPMTFVKYLTKPVRKFRLRPLSVSTMRVARYRCENGCTMEDMR